MDDQQAKDEFDRITLHQEIEKAQNIIKQYGDGMAHYHRTLQKHMYELGKLDERLGARS